MLFKKKIKLDENILKKIYKKDRLIRFASFLLGIVLVAIAFNLFILPSNVVYGMSGVGVILNKLFKFDPAITIFIGNIFLIILSFIFLGKEKSTNSILGSILLPIFIKLTENIDTLIVIKDLEPIMNVLYGAIITGFGLGLVFKAGFTTGGTDILNQIASKYLKISVGSSMFVTDGLIILTGLIAFNINSILYSIITLYIISMLTDKVVLGISDSKTFYIITRSETEVKKFIMNYLNHGVTVLDGRGGYTGDNKKIIMCSIPTKEYFIVKEAIHDIDKTAFFVVTDSYEVHGGE